MFRCLFQRVSFSSEVISFAKISKKIKKYSGDKKNGVPEGNGSVLFENGAKYVGSFHQGKYHGYGKFTTVAGDIIEGKYLICLKNVLFFLFILL